MNELHIPKLIGIVGRICSGKSTIADNVCSIVQCTKVSFGEYLLNYSQAKQLPTSRKALQDLGEVFIKTDHSQFLQNVLNQYTPFPSLAVIEGIRHSVIYNELRRLSNRSLFIYIDVPLELRFERYNLREKEIDRKVTIEEFIKIDNHSVEEEIQDIMPHCDLCFKHDSYESELAQLLLTFKNAR